MYPSKFPPTLRRINNFNLSSIHGTLQKSHSALWKRLHHPDTSSETRQPICQENYPIKTTWGPFLTSQYPKKKIPFLSFCCFYYYFSPFWSRRTHFGYFCHWRFIPGRIELFFLFPRVCFVSFFFLWFVWFLIDGSSRNFLGSRFYSIGTLFTIGKDRI